MTHTFKRNGAPSWSDRTGWVVLGALLSFLCQMVACDDVATSDEHGVHIVDQDKSTVAATVESDSENSACAEHVVPARTFGAAAPHGKASRVPPEGAFDAAREQATVPLPETASSTPTATSEAASAFSGKRDASWGTPEIKRLVVARGVEDREPLPLDAARVAEPVVAFLELSNDQPTPARVRITFVHESGLEVGLIDLEVPPRMQRYRTWGRTRNISRPGDWTVVVTGPDGEEMRRSRFSVTS